MSIENASGVVRLFEEESVEEIVLAVGDAGVEVLDLWIDQQELLQRLLAVVVPAVAEQIRGEIADHALHFIQITYPFISIMATC